MAESGLHTCGTKRSLCLSPDIPRSPQYERSAATSCHSRLKDLVLAFVRRYRSLMRMLRALLNYYWMKEHDPVLEKDVIKYVIASCENFHKKSAEGDVAGAIESVRQILGNSGSGTSSGVINVLLFKLK
jgi:hypothetical protein